MVEYAKDQKSKGNFNNVAEKFIMKTGEEIFIPIKYHFMGVRNKEYEQLVMR